MNDHGDEWELIDANERIPGFLEANKALSISVEPSKAATSGFFVALFRRKYMIVTNNMFSYSVRLCYAFKIARCSEPDGSCL